uniref:Transposase n=1 Tax=Candidatus Kentrum sp. LFY TaxID=2126342 RepID=A0A450UGA1_9GAMM|nr:MAG: Transposase [Candidatus Kentron sp. LFY]
MATTVLQSKDYTGKAVLCMAMELSSTKWKLGFSNGSRDRIATITAGDREKLLEQISLTKEKLGLPENCPVVSCYEAGRDGFWIHRMLEMCGITNLIFDSSSIEVNRRKRRVKTDKVDVTALLRLLQRYLSGERRAVSVVRVPSIEEEDQMRLDRERKRLIKEHTAHTTRIESLLIANGVPKGSGQNFLEWLETVENKLGNKLMPDLKADIRREYERLQLVKQQLKKIHQEQKRRIKEEDTKAIEQIITLMKLRGVGPQSSWLPARVSTQRHTTVAPVRESKESAWWDRRVSEA